jgi:hypothetical protein
MKRLSSTSWLFSALVLLCGCGGGVRTSRPPSDPSSNPSQGLNVVGNWQFTTASTVPGTLPLTIAGSINQSGSVVSGAVHVDGSNCFDRLTAMGLTGTRTDSSISLTSTSVVGQVATFTGNITDTAFTGTYTIHGGCADGEQGNVTGIKIPTIANTLSGTFTTSGGQTFDVTADLRVTLPSPEQLLSVRPVSVRGRSRRERSPQAALSWARLWPLKLTLATAPSLSLVR